MPISEALRQVRMRRRLFLRAGLIAAPALVLALLSWRSLRQEREARRGELTELASAAAQLAVRDLESEIRQSRASAWQQAGTTPEELVRTGLQGHLAAFRTADGRFLYPIAVSRDAPSLEDRLRREYPELLPTLASAADLEFVAGRKDEAARAYLRLSEQVEAPATRAALLYAAFRARPDPALGENLLKDFPTASSESGIPYAVLAQARLLRANPDLPQRSAFLVSMAAAALPGLDRELVLRDLAADLQPAPRDLRDALADARALGRLEELLRSPSRRPGSLYRVDEAAFFLDFREDSEGVAGLAISLRLTRSWTREGVTCTVDGFESASPAGEILHREPSTAFPDLVVSARLTDASRLEPPVRRLVLTGGLVVCLFAALLFGVVALVRRVEQEVSLARAKGDFVSGVSHELKTPLTSIRMFAEMLEAGKVSDDAKRREYYRLIHRESLRLSRLVENVLDFARLEDGRKTFSFKPWPLRDLVRSSAETFRALLDLQGVEFHVDAGEDPLPVLADADAIQGAVLNLLDNAHKYGRGKIDLRLVQGDGRARIVVSDNGPGIPPEDREKIFDRFYRGSAATQGPAGGAGLGLSLVRHVAQAHQGSISVECGPEGTRFILSLPL